MTLHDFKEKFDVHLINFINKKRESYYSLVLDLETRLVFDHMVKYIEGGKRIRPYCAYLAFSDSGKGFTNKHWLVLVAIELIHVLALIHDDIIDRAPDRRGILSMHKFIEKSYPVIRGDLQHFGYSQAILFGDIIFAASFQALSESSVSTAVHTKIHQLLDEVIIGQMMDVRLAYTDFVSQDVIIAKSKYKTALYTFARPFELGCILSGSHDDVQRSFYSVGKSLGILYQLQDDFLDVFDTKNALQKKLMNDIQEGQQTFVTSCFLEIAKKEERGIFLKYFGKKISEKEIPDIQNLLFSAGVDRILLDKILKDFANIKEEIDCSPFQEETKKMLYQVVETLKNRMPYDKNI
jgi:geranylgeranyl diphosphate synthase type I